MIDEAVKHREAAKRRYSLAHTQLREIKYRHGVEALIDDARALRALDRMTGRQQGHRLYESVQGLRVPTTADSDYPQSVKLVEPDGGALLKCFEDELETALLAEMETI